MIRWCHLCDLRRTDFLHRNGGLSRFRTVNADLLSIHQMHRIDFNGRLAAFLQRRHFTEFIDMHIFLASSYFVTKTDNICILHLLDLDIQFLLLSYYHRFRRRIEYQRLRRHSVFQIPQQFRFAKFKDKPLIIVFFPANAEYKIFLFLFVTHCRVIRKFECLLTVICYDRTDQSVTCRILDRLLIDNLIPIKGRSIEIILRRHFDSYIDDVTFLLVIVIGRSIIISNAVHDHNGMFLHNTTGVVFRNANIVLNINLLAAAFIHLYSGSASDNFDRCSLGRFCRNDSIVIGNVVVSCKIILPLSSIISDQAVTCITGSLQQGISIILSILCTAHVIAHIYFRHRECGVISIVPIPGRENCLTTYFCPDEVFPVRLGNFPFYGLHACNILSKESIPCCIQYI